MEKSKEQIEEMTAAKSLSLITETLNNSRRDILRNNSKYFVLWGCLLTVMSLAIYLLWSQVELPVVRHASRVYHRSRDGKARQGYAPKRNRAYPK